MCVSVCEAAEKKGERKIAEERKREEENKKRAAHI